MSWSASAADGFQSVCAEVSSHFGRFPARDALNATISSLPLVAAPYALEYYLPSKKSGEDGLHFYIKSEMQKDLDSASDTVPQLLLSILSRIRTFLLHLPPGLSPDQRDLDERLASIQNYLAICEAIVRIERRILAGPPVQQSKKELQKDPNAEETPDFGAHFRVKPSKQQKKQVNGSNNSLLHAEEALEAADKALITKGRFPELRTKEDLPDFKACVRRRCFRLYIALINHLRQPIIRAYTLKRFCEVSNWPVPETIQAALNSEGASLPVAPTASQPATTPFIAVQDLISRSESSQPASHPAIRPLKAARLFECDANDLGPWQVYFASRSISHFRQLDKTTMLMVIKKIRELSHGHFSGDNMKSLKGTSEIPIFEAKCSRDLRIVYQIDLYSDASQGIQKQVLKLWGIVSHAAMDENRLWSAIANEMASNKSKEYAKRVRERAQIRKTTGEGVSDVITPLSFPRLDDHTVSRKNDSRALSESDWTELHDLLALQKWLPYSKALVNAAVARFEEATHAFLLSEYEQQVVNEEGSCFVIGRSGTGKTSCALFRLLGLEQSCRKENVPMRQVFVTKSPVLASKIKDYYLKLRQTLDVSDLTPKEIAKANAKAQERDIELNQQEDQVGDLPAKWSELEDRHFPLFLSFDHFCALLEADYGIKRLQKNTLATDRQRAAKMMKIRITTGSDVRKEAIIDLDGTDALSPASGSAVDRSAWLHHVDADAFTKHYWPRFDETLVKGLDPMLCFAEFVGVLQDSEEAVKSKKGFMTREAYQSLSHRAQATFAHARDRIYDLLLVYRKMKAQRGDWDAADRTLALLQAMQGGFNLPKIHRLYVDESQDNLLSDVQLLKKIVSDPNGFLFAGDTAQSVSAAAFRFEDLSAAFFRAEKEEPLVLAGARSALHPKTFNLLTNYRSHRGITNVAATLVDLIVHFFPNSIDTLGRETGIVEGSLPLIFDGFEDSSDLKVESFLFGAGDTTMEFGAEQCIIVRNDNARMRLRKLLGDDFGLILTVYESKGLEFSDVLLYDFFTESQAQEVQWRLLYSLLDDCQGQAPTFDYMKHSVLLNELRHLYVAVTRARNRLWIFDASKRIDPLKRYLKSKGLVQLCKPGDRLPEMAVSSTPKQWWKTAKSLFERKLWLQAANCFARSGDSHWRDVALASMQEDSAREAKKAGQTAKVYLKEFEKAASMLETAATDASAKNASNLLRRAAESYLQANMPLHAAACYEKTQDWTAACQLYRKNHAFAETMRLLQQHAPPELDWLASRQSGEHDSRCIDAQEAGVALDTSRMFLVKNNKLNTASALFQSSEDHLEWLQDYGFDTGALSLLESLGQHERCAEIYLGSGQLTKAASSYSKVNAHQSAWTCLYDHLLLKVPLGTRLIGEQADGAAATEVKNTLKRLKALPLSLDKVNATVMAYECAAEPTSSVLPLLEILHEVPVDESLLVHDLVLQRAVKFPALSQAQRRSYISVVARYADLCREICFLHKWPAYLNKALGFRHPATADGQAEDSDRLIVPLSSPIFKLLPSTAEHVEEGAIVRQQEVQLPVSGFLASRLFDLLQTIFQTVHESREAWPPCLPFALNRHCKDGGDCWRSHLQNDINENIRYRLEFWCSLLPLSRHLGWLAQRFKLRKYERDECQRARRSVLDGLAQAILPSHPIFGSVSGLLLDVRTASLLDTRLLYAECRDALESLSSALTQSRFLEQLLAYSLVAAHCHMGRFTADFPHFTAMTRDDAAFRLHDRGNRTFGFAVYTFLKDIEDSANVSVDVFTQALSLLESIIEHQLPVHLNGFLYFLQTLVLIAILGSRQAGRRNSGFDYLLLPRALAHQAASRFAKTQFQMYKPAVGKLVRLLARLTTLMWGQNLRFHLDGQPLLGAMRPLLAACTLRLLVIIAQNSPLATSYPAETDTRNIVLQEIAILRAEAWSPVNRDTHGYRMHEMLQPLFDVKHREDFQAAIVSSSKFWTFDPLLQIFLGHDKICRTVRGVTAVQAGSIEELCRRWSGLPTEVVNEPFKGDNLVPPQILTRAKTARTAPNKHASATPDVTLRPTGETSAVRPEDIPLPADNEDPVLEVNDHLDDIPQADASDRGDLILEYDSATQEVVNEAMTDCDVRRIVFIQLCWRRHCKRKKAAIVRQAADADPVLKYQSEMYRLMRRYAHLPRLFRYRVVVNYPPLKVALDLVVNESKAMKEKLAKKFRNEVMDLEWYHHKITAINSIRACLLDARKSLALQLTQGDLNVTKRTLTQVRNLSETLRQHAGNAARLKTWDEVTKLFQAGQAIFEEAPPPPTEQKPKRPTLNMQESLEDIDGDQYSGED